MKKFLMTTTAAVALAAATATIASAECEIVDPQIEERVMADPQARNRYSQPAMRDIRDLRNAALTLAEYGKDDACQEVAETVREMLENPEEQRRTTRSGDERPIWNSEDSTYAFEETQPIGEMGGRMTAERIIGADVRGSNNETVGEISDIVLDASGSPAYVVVAYGGFLGLGEEESAVPFDQLKVSADGEVFYISMTAEQLENAPRFERGSFEWLEDEEWRNQNEQYYSGNAAEKQG